ncbi:MAG: hypothetical protein ACT4PY_16820 [Armatimonadota bacterium]
MYRDIAKVLITLSVLVGLAGPMALAQPVSAVPANEILRFATISKGGWTCHSGGEFVVRTLDAWEQHVSDHRGGEVGKPGASCTAPGFPNPGVDFARHSIVAIFASGNAARDVQIVRIVRANIAQDVVYYSLELGSANSPGPARPYHIVETDRVLHFVRFVREVKPIDAPPTPRRP